MALGHLLFPPLCVGCGEHTGSLKRLFCAACTEQFHLLIPVERCRFCFAPLGECTQCLKSYRRAAAFPYRGAPAALVRACKYGNRPALAQTMAAWMVVQLECLSWPSFDFIIPVPQSWGRRLQRGYNQSLLIAEEMGKMLSIPVSNVLKRRSGGVSQSQLTQEQRKQLDPDLFLWSRQENFSGLSLLLVDDVTTTGTTLLHCLDRLSESCPQHLSALTFCITD